MYVSDGNSKQTSDCLSGFCVQSDLMIKYLIACLSSINAEKMYYNVDTWHPNFVNVDFHR
jgi:hypothetical protein